MLVRTHCPLGGPDEADVELWPATLDETDLTGATFSARREPDRRHHRMVRNRVTGCVRADPVLDEETLDELYGSSGLLAASDVSDLAAATYARWAKRIWSLLPDRRGVLEIGCGSGHFLAHMRRVGFERVSGIEPSRGAVAGAPAEVRECIVNGLLEPGLFPPGSFSLICSFQVLDHLPRPNELLQLCRDLLVPGGVLYLVCHNIRSLPARLLGQRCPMVDIQHVILYDSTTLRALLERNGFAVYRVSGVGDRYPLSYWLHLAPLPKAVKRLGRAALRWARLGNAAVSLRLGNMAAIAKRPEADDMGDAAEPRAPFG